MTFPMPFYTEKRINDFLMSETRKLVSKDGKTYAVTGLNLMWRHYDTLTPYLINQEDKFIQYTLHACKTTGLPFDLQFHEIVGFYSNQWKYNPSIAILPKLMRSIQPGFGKTKIG